MKQKLTLLLLFCAFLFARSEAQCSGSFAFQYDGPLNHISFRDTSVAPAGWQRVYTRWNFNDGTKDSGQIVNHVFPQFRSYTVVRDVMFAQPGNPTIFCAHKDSVRVDSLPANYSGIGLKFHVKRLDPVTYGLYSFFYGCPQTYSEFNVDTSQASSAPPHMASLPTGPTGFKIFSLIPGLDPIAWDFQYQSEMVNVGHGQGGLGFFFVSEFFDSIVDLPIPPCRASFFLAPDSTNKNNWVIYDYSSGTNLSYSWDFGDSTTSTLPSPAHVYAYPGNHQICLTVSGTPGCSDTWCDTAFIGRGQFTKGMQSLRTAKGPSSLGISEQKPKKTSLQVFPNPASDEITVQLNDAGKHNLVIAIYDLMGREMILTQNPKFIHKSKVSVESLPTGMYLLYMRDQNGKTLGSAKFTKK